MPKDIHTEPPPHGKPRLGSQVRRSLLWGVPALLAFCASSVALSPAIRGEIEIAREQPQVISGALSDASPAAMPDTVALQQRMSELNRQMDTVSAAMTRLIVAIQRRDDQAARAVDRIAELREDLSKLQRQLKRRPATESEAPASP